MGCGCKKKHEVPVQQPAQIRLTETPRPPEPIKPPAQQDVEKIVDKLNEIVTPH